MRTLLCKASSSYEDAKTVHFLLPLDREIAKRLVELMEFVQTLEKSHPEIISLGGVMKGVGCFLESPAMILELKKATKSRGFARDLEHSWIELPETFKIRTGYGDLPVGAFDVVAQTPITVYGDSLCFTATEKGTFARFESESLEYEFVKGLVV